MDVCVVVVVVVGLMPDACVVLYYNDANSTQIHPVQCSAIYNVTVDVCCRNDNALRNKQRMELLACGLLLHLPESTTHRETRNVIIKFAIFVGR